MIGTTDCVRVTGANAQYAGETGRAIQVLDVLASKPAVQVLLDGPGERTCWYKVSELTLVGTDVCDGPDQRATVPDHTGIDYAALAKAAHEWDFDNLQEWDQARDGTRETYDQLARAVVAALRDQGLVVMRADDATRALNWYSSVSWSRITRPDTPEETMDDVAAKRIRSALAAPGDGEEHP